MVDEVADTDTSGVTLKHLDVVTDSTDELVTALTGVDSLVIAVGFVPGNPVKMVAAAHAVDNLGTVRLIDAAKITGVKKVVMISSILTNGLGPGRVAWLRGDERFREGAEREDRLGESPARERA